MPIIKLTNALTDDWFSQPYDVLLTEAKRIGALVGLATSSIRWRTITCQPYKCILNIVSTGIKVRVIDNKQKIGETFVRDPNQVNYAVTSDLKCPFHLNLITPAEHYAGVLKESRLVTGFISLMARGLPELFDTRITIDGSETRLKEEYKYDWSFDRARNLVVDIASFPAGKETAFRTLADNAKFEGRIIIRG